MITAGMLNKIVTIQQLTAASPAQNAYGEKNTTWTTFATIWASVEPFVGREFFAQQQIQSDITLKIRMRYLSGVLTNMRVLYGSRILTIKSVIDVKEAHKEMLLMCSEGVENA